MATDFAESFIEIILGWLQNNVVGTGIVHFITGEGFLEIGKAGPRVIFRGAFRGDSPEIEDFFAIFIGIENQLNSKDAGGMKATAGVGLGALEIISSVVVIKNETSGNDFLFICLWIRVFDDVKSCKILF